jgi:hypothetical protein
MTRHVVTDANGRYRIANRARAGRAAAGCEIMRVEAENVAPNQEIPLAPGQTLSGVRIVLAYGSANQPPK